MSEVEERLAAEGLALPELPQVAGQYVHAVSSGDLVFMSGQAARTTNELLRGKVGVDLTVEEGYDAARLAALSLLSALKEVTGDLERVQRVVKVFGMVNCSADFEEHPRVIDGASEVLLVAFGAERGQHARTAVGMHSLPFQIPVEVECIFEVTDRSQPRSPSTSGRWKRPSIVQSRSL